MIIAQQYEALHMGVIDELMALAPQDQYRLVRHELRKPRRPDTIRRKLLTYWPVLLVILEQEPSLFDALLAEYVAEIEDRDASVPAEFRRHMREIAES